MEERYVECVMEWNVCLENVVFYGFLMIGIVKVKNIVFVKEVIVRYIVDGWRSYWDVWVDYVLKLLDGEMDRF